MFKFLLPLFLIGSIAHADVSVPRAKQYLWTVYDVAQSGGQSVAHPLGVKLPAGAILTNAWVYINTAFTDSGTGSFAISCAGTRDIMDYNDITALSMNSMVGIASLPNPFTGTASYIPQNMPAAVSFASSGSVVSACEVNAVVRGDSGYVPLTGGKATIILEYFKL
jgi:hypothetical protein